MSATANYSEDHAARMVACDSALAKVRTEYERAVLKFPKVLNSTHEGHAVLKEEVDEMWDDIKANRKEESRVEAIQVGAMAVRYIIEA